MTTLQITPPPLSPQSMADLMCTVMVFCQGQNEEGHDFWAYICIKPSMAKAFRDACDNDVFNLEDYGTVIEYGEGANVPLHVCQRMERYYGADHAYEDTLRNALDAL